MPHDLSLKGAAHIRASRGSAIHCVFRLFYMVIYLSRFLGIPGFSIRQFQRASAADGKKPRRWPERSVYTRDIKYTCLPIGFALLYVVLMAL